MPLIAGAGALIGGIGGLFKSGPDLNMQGRDSAARSMEAYRNLVSKGAGEQDVTAALGASREYADTLRNTASSGLYNMSAGNRLAEQQFAPQRQQLAQSIQDQMARANRAASAAGRSSNDPILRARLGAESMRQGASLSAQQSAAAMDLGRQSTLDSLSLGGQRVNMLQGLADQAFAGQQNMFNMGQNLFNMDLGAAGYEQGRGGGLKGAITGAITGAGAGLQFAQGFGAINNAKALTDSTVTLNKAMPGIMQNMAKTSANMTMQQQPMSPMSIPSADLFQMPYSNAVGYMQPGVPYATGVSNGLQAGTPNPYPGMPAGFDPNSRWNTMKNWWGGSVMDR